MTSFFLGGGGGGVYRGFGKKIITNSYFLCMSKCRQFKGLSTGMFIFTMSIYSAAYQGYL